MASEKVLPLDELAEKARAYKKAGKTIALCHGAFDLLHPGHLRHLQRASQEGDVLFVTLTADSFVNKGPGRPVFPENLRAESLASLECVAHVGINHATTAIPVLNAIQPNVYVKGGDYVSPTDDVTGNITREAAVAESHGGRIFFTNEVTFSSSKLLNEHFSVFPPRTKGYLNNFKQLFGESQILERLEALRQKKVLVVGEAIIDEYCYAKPLGLTGKSGNILAAQYQSKEAFAGGALAVANHVAGFADEVTLLTGIGSNKARNRESFIQEALLKNVTPLFHYFDEPESLVKRRYVDLDMSKLFEVYFNDAQSLGGEADARACDWIRKNAPDFDMVLVPDYGNGFISDSMVAAICDSANFLSVNTQLNSGNRGYHVVTRYPRADFVSLNEPEIRLAAHNRQDLLEPVAAEISKRVGAQYTAVTLGTHGAVLLDLKQQWLHEAPPLSAKVVDRIGAGDAFLSLAGLALCAGHEPEVALFLGSAAAAIDVQIVCNRETVNFVDLAKYIKTMLK